MIDSGQKLTLKTRKFLIKLEELEQLAWDHFTGADKPKIRQHTPKNKFDSPTSNRTISWLKKLGLLTKIDPK
jgi:hypothetical protein